MTHDEALKLALEALLHVYHEDEAHPKTLQAITAIKEALAKPEQILPSVYSNTHQTEQEPVAWCAQPELDWLNSDKRGASAYVETTLSKRRDGLAQTALYTTPPQRTWVGLTDEEINTAASVQSWKPFAKAIEAKLKEKNT